MWEIRDRLVFLTFAMSFISTRYIGNDISLTHSSKYMYSFEKQLVLTTECIVKLSWEFKLSTLESHCPQNYHVKKIPQDKQPLISRPKLRKRKKSSSKSSASLNKLKQINIFNCSSNRSLSCLLLSLQSSSLVHLYDR